MYKTFEQGVPLRQNLEYEWLHPCVEAFLVQPTMHVFGH